MALSDRPILARAGIGLVVVAALALSACGRKGPLEAPPTAAVDEPGMTDSPKEAAKKPDTPFILDPLL